MKIKIPKMDLFKKTHTNPFIILILLTTIHSLLVLVRWII